jgi:hypothetical protein
LEEKQLKQGRQAQRRIDGRWWWTVIVGKIDLASSNRIEYSHENRQFKQRFKHI